jgi:hypothetical protein
MTIRLSIDRFEGARKQVAVLLADDGTQINFPKALLPKEAKAGDILSVQIERDTEATRHVADATKKIQDDLKRRDPGGDAGGPRRPIRLAAAPGRGADPPRPAPDHRGPAPGRGPRLALLYGVDQPGREGRHVARIDPPNPTALSW